jgi:hypothetical protein
MSFDTEDPENGYDNSGYTRCLIMLLHKQSSADIRVKGFPVSSVSKNASDHAALLQEVP